MQYKVLNYIRKHEALSFIVMTYLFTWSIWYVASCVNGKSIYNEDYRLLYELGAFGPTIVSIFFTGILYKKEGIKKLFIRLTKWKYNPIYYVIAISWYPIMFYIAVLIYNFMNNNSKMEFGGKPSLILVNTILMIIFGGPLGEELGWRGYLLPRFQKLSPLKSGLLIGIVWSCWHIPLFLMVGTFQYDIPFLLFLIYNTYLAVLITWVFNRTNGSLIFPILIHNFSNVAVAELVPGLKPISFLFALILIIFVLLTMIPIVSDMVKNKSRKVVNV